MVAIKQQLVSNRKSTYAGTNGRKYITIHETDNFDRGAGAERHAKLQSNGFSASWHWQVDDKVAIQSYPHTVRCWAAGDGHGNGNYNSIHIEICVNPDSDFKTAVKNAAALVRKIMKDENIPIAHVVQHNKWSGKNCPQGLRNGSRGINWNQFKEMLKGEVTVASKEPSSWAKSVWEKATKNGIVDGTAPKEPLTREQFVVILDRLGLNNEIK